MSETKKINFCLVGAGRISQVHGQTLSEHPWVNVKYVVDVIESAAKKLAEDIGAEVSSIETALNDDSIDAVMIGSPTNTHADLIERFAKAGKAVFCEKPVDLDIARARDVAQIVKDTGSTCAIGFNRRFDQTFGQLYSQLKEGRIGKLEQVIITSRDPLPPPTEYVKVSGGIFRDMMIHDLDIARWLLGEEPVEVMASGSCVVDPAIGEAGDIDSAMVILKTASGKLCQITNCRRAAYGYDQRIEAFGEKGMLQANNHRTHEVQFSGDEGVVADKPKFFFLERYLPAFRTELQDFVESILNNRAPIVTIEDGVRALELADACLESYKTGKAVKL